MARVHNFNAGPAGLPLPALLKAQEELVEIEGTGMSVMEHSHRGATYERIHNEAKSLLVQLLGVPDDYEVLFLQGGASLQFAMLPMNFLPVGASADYLITGGWSEKAFEEANRVGKARVAASTAVDKKYTRVPRQDEISLDPAAAYVHITTNNTLFGTQWHYLPDVGAPLIADMSSDILWKKVDVSRYAMIYAGAQKNIGPSGVVVVILKKSLLATARTDIPIILRYDTHAKNNSLYNTPPTFGIYLIRNVLRFIADEGGLDAMEAKNREKGAILYGALDEMSSYYAAPVERDSRSFMNVVFRLPNEALEKKFVADAAAEGMVGLAGHRSTGGIRASTYNAVSVDSVAFLVDFMRRFRRANP